MTMHITKLLGTLLQVCILALGVSHGSYPSGCNMTSGTSNFTGSPVVCSLLNVLLAVLINFHLWGLSLLMESHISIAMVSYRPTLGAAS